MTFKDHRARKVKINSFHRWSTAWCIFAQAHLYYHPEDFYLLFCYHTLMVQHVSQYKFEACHKYDNAFRLIVQNERHLPWDKKTCYWTHEADHLRNKYLFNNPLPTCDHCKTPGHTVSQCKSKKHSDNSQNNTLFSTQPVPLMSQQFNQPPPSFSSSQQWRQPRNPYSFRAPHYASNNTQQQQFTFRAPNTNNNQRNSIPPNQKPCRRFNLGEDCYKPPCMFLHACKYCWATDHGISKPCPHLSGASSTAFIPSSGP